MEVSITWPKSTSPTSIGHPLMDAGYFSHHPKLCNKIYLAAPNLNAASAILERSCVLAIWDFSQFYVLHLPIEYKSAVEAVPHGQVILDMCTVQNQLKILNHTTDIIYGISLIKSVATILWTSWADDYVKFEKSIVSYLISLQVFRSCAWLRFITVT